VSDVRDIDALLDRIGRQPFRRRFALHGRDRAIAELRGPEATRQHARELVVARLARAHPRNDGRQTPYRGHPVFVAQHATATCCRTCLSRWHGIAPGHALDDDELAYVVDVICRWIARQMTERDAPR
jgi:hypothetical protein